MANVLNRTTKGYLTSVNTPDYPSVDWIISPDLSAVVGFPSKYWTITGDVVTLMSPAERTAVDAAEAAAALTQRRATNKAEIDEATSEGVRVRALIHVLNKRDNYLVNRIEELQVALDAVKATTGNNIASIRNAIPSSWLATNTRPLPNAVQDYKDEIDTGAAD